MINISSQVQDPTLSIDTNNSENIIIKTIDILSKCSEKNIFAIIKKIREIIFEKYKNCPQNPKKLKDVKLFRVDDVKVDSSYNSDVVARITANIRDYIHSVADNKIQSSLQNQLKNEISKAVEFCLNKRPNLGEIVDLSCTLDFIDFSKDHSDHEIYKMIIRELSTEIYYSPNRDVFLDIAAAFSLRKVKVGKYDLFKNFYNKIIRNLNTLTSLEISLAAKAFVQAKLFIHKMLPPLRNVILKKSNDFAVNEIVNTLWSYCYANWSENKDPSITRKSNQELIQAFKIKLTNEIGQLNVSQTVRIAWTFKNMNIRDEDFFNSVRRKIDIEISNLNPPELGNITKLLCNVNNTDDTLLLKLLKVIETKQTIESPYFTKEEIAHIIYAVLIKFCQSDKNFCIYEEFIKKMLNQLINIKDADWDNDMLRMIQIIGKFYVEKSSSIDSTLIENLSKFLKPLKPVENKYEKSSGFHLDVTKHLSRLLRHEKLSEMKNEFLFEDYFRIDIAFPKYQLAIEVDGHCHFDEIENYIPKNILKETMLDIRKWNLVRISHKDWPGNNEYTEERFDSLKREFLLNKLSKFSCFRELF